MALLGFVEPISSLNDIALLLSRVSMPLPGLCFQQSRYKLMRPPRDRMLTTKQFVVNELHRHILARVIFGCKVAATDCGLFVFKSLMNTSTQAAIFDDKQ